MLTIADFKLGRMVFPTIYEGFKEAVGDTLDTVGAGLAAGERKPRSFPLTIPVRASSHELDPYADGDRMRRQVRSLMDNARLRLGGLYMEVAFDAEQNGWMLIGGGDLEYAEGGVTLADYKLTLNDAYRVGQRRTHRRALRIEARDRRLSTTPRDTERLVYSTGFAASLAVVQVALPHGVTDVLSRAPGGVSQAPAAETVDGGSVTLVKGVIHGDVVSYEQPEEDMDLGDVLVFDRRGVTNPVGLMAAKDPQVDYGWEEVYGQNYPLTEGDVPVLQNGLCRVRYLVQGSSSVFAVDQFSGGIWVERQRIAPLLYIGATARYGVTFLSAQVREWTPERAVVLCRFATNESTPFDCYLTLHRGWSGPRVETYVRPAGYSNEYQAAVIAMPAPNFGFAITSSKGARASSESWSETLTFGESDEPWFALSQLESGTSRLSYAINVPSSVVLRGTDSTLFGATRKGFSVGGTKTGGGTEALKLRTGYASLEVRQGATGSAVFEAETYRNVSGTTSETSVAEASGGKAVQDTQAAATNRTVYEPAGGTALGLTSGSTYAVFVRARAVTAGGTASIKAEISTASATKTTTSNTFTWIYMGTITKSSASARFAIWAWRSAGTGNVEVDRVVVVPHTMADQEGAGDVGAQSLYDSRAISELVAR